MVFFPCAGSAAEPPCDSRHRFQYYDRSFGFDDGALNELPQRIHPNNISDSANKNGISTKSSSNAGTGFLWRALAGLLIIPQNQAK